ncbi:MAG TPA: symmetrical bis(5'-nucleosyl)-tetraphosphatase [Gammaproteobacteria bacterium]|jgi:bis(5'-nucleosyl)-tetraphosphatase (symmetrical)|nr:symmetrical bis(5'-nucleosyl)-tetraphosphatase [Gammaproteobacteria bacterium]
MATYAIGDIQGCAAEFDALLRKLRFRPSRDTLWLVGDLVNRGPDSLAVLRRVIGLGRSAIAVLGNHDLHLLATVAGRRELSPADTFHDVLEAPDADRLIDWLRHRPLLHYDAAARRVLVHAGIPPVWSLRDARTHAREIETLLRGRRWRAALRTMYGNEPTAFSPKLGREQRRRFTINALTRMRYCDRRGHLDLRNSGPPGTQDEDLLPWFDVPDRKARDVRIVFGHWAALGLLRRADVIALDTGCAWGNRLTAVRLDGPGRAVSVRCSVATLRMAHERRHDRR